MNPSETGDGLKLNISKDDNSQNLELALEVSEYFRFKKSISTTIVSEVTNAVLQWEKFADNLVPSKEISRMKHAFRVAEIKLN